MVMSSQNVSPRSATAGVWGQGNILIPPSPHFPKVYDFREDITRDGILKLHL
jgi:hypothetical protein